jgi:hypothetical protein
MIDLPKSPVAELTKEQMRQIMDMGLPSMVIGQFNPNLLLSFASMVETACEGGDCATITVMYRADIQSGTIIAETHTEPKRYFGVAGITG